MYEWYEHGEVFHGRKFSWSTRAAYKPVMHYVFKASGQREADTYSIIRQPKRNRLFFTLVKWRPLKDNDNGQPIWYPWPRYYIKSSKEWLQVRSVVEKSSLDKLGWGAPDRLSPLGGRDQLYDQVHYLTRELDQLKESYRKLESEYGELTLRSHWERIEKEIATLQLDEIKEKYELRKEQLEKFQGKMTGGETEIHDFLKDDDSKDWLLGLEYKKVEHEFYFPPGTNENRFDILCQRYDDRYDIYELKAPNLRKVIREQERDQTTIQFATETLSQSIGQVIKYFEACDRHYGAGGVIKPYGFIVLGRQRDEEINGLRNLSFYLHNIYIQTYDELCQKAKLAIDFYEDKIKEKESTI